MAEQDLITYAREAGSRGDDLFALLATDATASEADIRRAFRRKALTAHPDKAGEAYDPALYERLERARDVLLHAPAREAYDAAMRAVLQRRAQLEHMSLKRRQLVEELERREEEAKRARTAMATATGAQTMAVPRDAERVAMAARGRAKMEEMRRLREEAEARERLAREREAGPAWPSVPSTTGSSQPATARASSSSPDGKHTPPPAATDDKDYDERIAELEKRLKEKQQRKAERERRRADKKARKSGTTPSPAAPLSPGREPSSNPPPRSSSAAGSQADQDKPPTAPPTAPPPPSGVDTNPPKASDRFASTLARLRAAQARKDEDRRRRAAEEQAPAAAGVSAP